MGKGPMPDLSFSVVKVEPVAFAASPMLNFTLSITDAESQPIHAIALRCQIRIEPARRAYDPAEKERLRDLFGEPSRWGQTMRSMLWAHSSVVVPPLNGATSVELPVPCTYDFNVAAVKYFYGLEDGDVPLCFLFSGTIFYATDEGTLQVCQISWEKEANFRLPMQVWKKMMEIYYPNTAWLALRKDAFDSLYDFKIRNSLPTWEAAIEKLLASQAEQVSP
jgi:hypothetical protein